MPDISSFPTLFRLSVLASALALSACNDSHSYEGTEPEDDDHHHHEPVESSGRIAISSSDNKLFIYDLAEERIISEFPLNYPAQAVYASPEYRYAVVVQRTDDTVSFVDSGLYQEDHGDHLHDYKVAPSLSGFHLQGALPTHYEVHNGQAALFFDGRPASADNAMQTASISLFSDSSIAASKVLARQNLATNMHGTAEPRGEYLLTTYRAADASSTLPDQVELYHQHGDHYHFETRFAEQCPGLHGSYSTGDYTLFGCTDGVLIVEQKENDFTATKLANPADFSGRIGSFTGHKARFEVIGYAGQDAYIIDPVNKAFTPLNWRSDTTVTRINALADAHGEHYVVLDSDGVLHVFDWQAGFAKKHSAAIISELNSTNPPVMTANQQNDTIYLTDPVAKQIIAVELEHLESSHIQLSFEPAKATWLGIAEPAGEEHHH